MGHCWNNLIIVMKLLQFFAEVGWNRDLSSLHQPWIVVGVGLFLFSQPRERKDYDKEIVSARYYFNFARLLG